MPAAPGFSTGLARGAAVANERMQLKAAKQQQRTNQVKAALDSSEKAALDLFNKQVELIGQSVQNGATSDQVQKLAQSAVQPIQAHALLLQQIRAQATAAGASPEQLDLLPDPNRFIQSHLGLLQTTVDTALQQTPEAKAQREADAKLAEAKRVADNLGLPMDRVAQAMGLAAAPQRPIEGIGPSGQPAFLQQGSDGLQPIPGATPIPKQGMTIETTPEGVKVTMGGTGKPEGMQKGTLAKIEQSVTASNDQLARLQGIQQSFDPAFLTYGGKFENFQLSLRSKINPDSISPEDRQWLTKYTDFTSQAIQNMNLYIKEITGAQMSAQEADRLRKGVPDPENDAPPVFKAKLDSNMKQFMLARARALYVYKNGIDKLPWAAMSLGAMNDMINQRADELTAQFAQQQGVSGQEARQKALEQVKQEFGL